MIFDYFYPDQAEQFAFFRIPKILFRDKRFKHISTDAKVLYGLMLDRVSLSVRNRWIDDMERVYIIFTLEEFMQELDCANQKATKLISELEEKAYLIERKRQGQGKPGSTVNQTSCRPTRPSSYWTRKERFCGTWGICWRQKDMKSACWI